MPGKHEREKVAGRVEIRDGEKIVAGKKGWERVAASKEMGRNMVGRKKIKQNKGIQMKKNFAKALDKYYAAQQNQSHALTGPAFCRVSDRRHSAKRAPPLGFHLPHVCRHMSRVCRVFFVPHSVYVVLCRVFPLGTRFRQPFLECPWKCSRQIYEHLTYNHFPIVI